jgi:hypothetical protein
VSRREGPPGRETAAARSGERRIWYGYGSLTRTEKNGLGLFLHDTTRVFAEVSVLSLPCLVLIMATPPSGLFDAKATGLLAWLTMTLSGTFVRGGWVRPLASTTPGWVRLAPPLLVLRLGYFNAVMLLAAFGGLAVGGPPGGPLLGLAWAGSVAVLGTLLFPRVAEKCVAWRGRSRTLQDDPPPT